MKRAVEREVAGPIEISGIAFYGPASVLETLVREEEARISRASFTAEAAFCGMLSNGPEGCCD